MVNNLILIILLSTCISCNSIALDNKGIEDNIYYKNEINYPYIASKKKTRRVLDNMNQVKKGMNKKEVIELLSAPDEYNPTYKNKSGKETIGFSFVYILSKKKDSGSVIDKAEKLIRIHFDNSDKLIWAYSINIEEFNNIEK